MCLVNALVLYDQAGDVERPGKKIRFLELQSQWILLGDSADGEVVRPDTVVHAHQNISVSNPSRLTELFSRVVKII